MRKVLMKKINYAVELGREWALQLMADGYSSSEIMSLMIVNFKLVIEIIRENGVKI